MKKVIRSGLFETNSSSVHTYVECSEEEYKRLEDSTAYLLPDWPDIRNADFEVKFVDNIKEYPEEKYREVSENWRLEDAWKDLTKEEQKLWVNIYDQHHFDFDNAYTLDLLSQMGVGSHSYGKEKVTIDLDGYI